MSNKNITKVIYEYIESNNISISQICKDTNISLEEIIREDRKLNATEMLRLCEYLNVQPEMFNCKN